jgi:nucleotide-binding universal stress UspA family protein
MVMTILCATDLLPKSDAAIERAGLLGDQLGADVTLLHVVAPAGSERVLEQTLQVAQEQMKARGRAPLWRSIGVPDVAVRAGNPARLILDTLRQSKPRLLVLGGHRKRPLRDALEGTIAEKVLASRTCPVLFAQHQAQGPYRRVLLALDVSATAGAAIRAAEALVLSSESDARIVHACDPPSQGMIGYASEDSEAVTRYLEGWTRRAARAMRGLLQGESANFARYQVDIAGNEPVPAIMRAVEHQQPDLVVMGTRGGGRLHRALLGSVANRVLHEIACDALIVPEGSFGSSQRNFPRHARHGAVDDIAPRGSAA